MGKFKDYVFSIMMSAFIGFAIWMFQIIYMAYTPEMLHLFIMDAFIGIAIGLISTLSFTYFIARFKGKTSLIISLLFVVNAVCTVIPFLILNSMDLFEILAAVIIVEIISISYALKIYRNMIVLKTQLKKKQEEITSTVK